MLMIRTRRPRGLSEIEAFTWFMPGQPPVDECWDWPASTDRYGYGQFSMNGGHRIVRAHQVSYRKFIGPIPNGALLLHSCDRPTCVQPSHLFPGSHADNTRQAAIRERLCSKLTGAQVLWIRKQRGLKLRVMAEMFGVTETTICDARSGKTWKHLQ